MTSLYNAFGGKRQIFRSALDRYSEQRTRRCLDEIEHLASPADRIRTFVARVIEAALDDPDRMGCLVINTAVELGPHDEEISEIVADHLAEVEAFFRRNFAAAQKAGDADPNISPEDAGRSFSALMFGLRVLARTRPERKMMEGAARPLLALLREGDRVSADHATIQNAAPENTHAGRC
ncbi:Transcriptional regulator, TetR family [Sinorhizobium sojae CCBAU 05684]|uniref:Transcriptional regulator, TetR family n=2 Tax=Sinorhizobium sojae TaxID=716925 RepID=A0A249P895_9HYPH|nr:Transcriptional regulator, TetR family [Sinorhizobium sojae CCBAU 05684]